MEAKELKWIDVNEPPIIESNAEMFEVKFLDGSTGKVLYGNSGFLGEGNGWFCYKLPKFTHWRPIREELTINTPTRE